VTQGVITIACLNAGNYQGRGRTYVACLRRGLAKHLTIPHKLVCFTDDEGLDIDGVETSPLPHPDLKGWFNKIALFKQGVFRAGERVWYFDLDTMIVGNIDFIGDYHGRFAMLGPFFQRGINPVYAGPQSAAMAWAGGYGAAIWSKFLLDGFPNTPGGDQKFINDMQLNPELMQELFPGRFASYKGHCQRELPAGVAVVCFHGLPRPHQAGGWARKVWMGEA
jgi:hypothetical protein